MSPNNGTALAVVPTAVPANASTQLEPSTAEQAFWLASQLVKSGLLGRAVNKPEAAFAIILAGRELGLTAMQSLRSIHIIEGKPTLSSDLMAALVMRSPLCKYFRLVESTNTIARYETLRVGSDKPTPMSFSMDDAKQAGVANKNNWKTYPAAMLRARCIAALARVVYPDLLMGIYEEDEIGQQSTMPSTREAESVSQPRQQETEQAAPDEEAVDLWRSRFESATSLEEVKQLGVDCKKEVTGRPTLLAISVHVEAAKKRLEAAQESNDTEESDND
jgi:hypothetical protein